MNLRLLSLCLVALIGCKNPPELVSYQGPRQPLIIRNVDVVDVLTASIAKARDVYIRGPLIEKIVATSVAKPKGTKILDATGGTLLPGLIDAHIHLGNRPDASWTRGMPDPELNLARLLYSGVTTVLETGGMITDSFERRDLVAAGQLLGPNIGTTGPIFTAPDGHPVPMLEMNAPALFLWYLRPRLIKEVATAEEARAAVDEVAAKRPAFIKVVADEIPEDTPKLSLALLRTIVDHAKSRGVRSIAHIGRTEDAITAADAGVSAWVHGVYKERIPDEAIAKLAAYGIPMAPTLVVFESYGAMAMGEERVPTRLEEEVVPQADLLAFNDPPDDPDLTPGAAAMMKLIASNRANALDNVRRLHAAGVTILAGSDAQQGVYHGPGLHRELHLLSQAGLSNADVLRAATVLPARFISGSEDPPMGLIAAGKAADLVLFARNPLEDLGELSNIRAVIRGGRIIKRVEWADGRHEEADTRHRERGAGP